MQKMTTLVTQLSEEVKGLRQTKAQVDKFMTADMSEMIRDYTKEYLEENLASTTTPALIDLLRPIRKELNSRIRQNIVETLQSTPFYLQSNRAPPAPEDLTVEQLEALLATRLREKEEKTDEEAALLESLRVIKPTESCKEAAGKHKRSRKDDDPDADSQRKRIKSSREPSSSKQPPASKTSSRKLPASAPKSGPTAAEEPLMLHYDNQQEEPEPELTQTESPEQHAEPSSSTKTKKSKEKKKKHSKRFSWLEAPKVPEADWVTTMIKSHPPLETEEPLLGNTMQYAQSILSGL